MKHCYFIHANARFQGGHHLTDDFPYFACGVGREDEPSLGLARGLFELSVFLRLLPDSLEKVSRSGRLRARTHQHHQPKLVRPPPALADNRGCLIQQVLLIVEVGRLLPKPVVQAEDLSDLIAVPVCVQR